MPIPATSDLDGFPTEKAKNEIFWDCCFFAGADNDVCYSYQSCKENLLKLGAIVRYLIFAVFNPYRVHRETTSFTLFHFSKIVTMTVNNLSCLFLNSKTLRPIGTAFNTLTAFLFLLALVSSFGTFAQQSQNQNARLCGVYTKLGGLPVGYKGAAIYDRFGNVYTPEELLKQKAQATSNCAAGIFQLNFIGNFSQGEEMTVCEAFQEISDLISGGATEQIPIDIIQQPTSWAPGALAAASDFFTYRCGLAHSTVLQLLRGDGILSTLPTGVSAGVVHIKEIPRSGYTWHTINQTTTITATEYDLKTVALHEVLHILGFASRIGKSGLPLSGTSYSTWDKALYSQNVNDHLILPSGNDPSCCSKHEFNSQDFPNPAVLNDDCDINIWFYDLNNNPIAPVNYAELIAASNGEMANKLRACLGI